VGIGLGDYWMVEGEVSGAGLGTIALGAPVSYIRGPIVSSRAIEVLGSAVVDLRGKTGQSRLAPFVRAGFGSIHSGLDMSYTRCIFVPCVTTIITSDVWSPSYSFGAGVRVPITSAVGIRPEIRWSRTLSGVPSAYAGLDSDYWVRVFIGLYFLDRRR
jgi:hypothetical protein